MQNLTFCHAYLHIAIKTLESHPKCQPTQFQRHSQTLSTKPHLPSFRFYFSQYSIELLLWKTIQHFCPSCCQTPPNPSVQHPLPACLLQAFLKAHVCNKKGFISIFAILQEHVQSNFMVAVLQENLCMGPGHSWKKTTELQDKAWWHSVWPTPTIEPW